MKKLNKKGFTLIELLAVIVILAVLLAIAIPAVAKYITSSKKDTFIENAQSYAKAARSEALLGSFQFPINKNDAVVVPFEVLVDALENGGKQSSYGNDFDWAHSYVVIVNTGTGSNPKNEYYIAACDTGYYGIGDAGATSSGIVSYDGLKKKNIIKFSNCNGTTAISSITAGSKIKLVGYDNGSTTGDKTEVNVQTVVTKALIEQNQGD